VTAICPHCGYSLTRDDPIERDGWRLHATRGVTAPGGKRLTLTRAQLRLLVALAQADEALLGHQLCDLAGVRTPDSLDVLLSLTRRACRAAGVAVPFKSLGYGRGWGWCA
jgi:hypothetical protein